MGPNDVSLERVYPRKPGGAISAGSFSSGSDFEVVVEAEAGDAIFRAGPPYVLDIVVRDLTAGTAVKHEVGLAAAATSAPPLKGGINDATTWNAQAQQAYFTVRSTDLAGRSGHVCQIFAYLLAGRVDPDSSLASSPLFLIQP